MEGKVRDSEFVDQMRKYATELVTEVEANNQTYRHDNQTLDALPGLRKLRVKGKRAKCADRECGYRRSLSQTTNARCPNCHKKMESSGRGRKADVCLRLRLSERRISKSGQRAGAASGT